uniref:Large ribosomal subunit protein eL22 n=1 Tax=Cuerna arida TaxID=1464854 RepID=A0A1B6EMB6_9HEMI
MKKTLLAATEKIASAFRPSTAAKSSENKTKKAPAAKTTATAGKKLATNFKKGANATKKPYVAGKKPAFAAQKKTGAKKPVAKKISGKKGQAVVRGKSMRHKKRTIVFSIVCTHPVEDDIMDIHHFEKFISERFKVANKTNNFKNSVRISCDAKRVNISTDIVFSKRYLKYLTKKYLKKNKLRDWIRVVSSSPHSYELRYFQINNQDSDEEEDYMQ